MPGFLIDLDGTLYRGRERIPYADVFIRELLDRKLPFLLVTNNSSRTPEQVAEHLYDMGIEVGVQHIFTSSQAAVLYMEKQRRGKKVYMIGENGLLLALTEAGFTLSEDSPDYVVQGIDRDFSYAKMTSAVRHIMNGASYVLTNPDQLLPSDGGLMPGAGSIAAAIRTASGAEPIVIGKPSPIMMGYAIERLALSPADVWVIGDNAVTDIRGGAVSGCRTALVLTGLATPDNCKEQLQKAGVTPDLICSDLQAFSRHILQD